MLYWNRSTEAPLPQDKHDAKYLRTLRPHRRNIRNLARESRYKAAKTEGINLGIGSGSIGGQTMQPKNMLSENTDGIAKARDTRQLAAYKDTVFTAIRPIVVKASSQNIRCGWNNSKQAPTEMKKGAKKTKEVKIDEPTHLQYVLAKQAAPDYIRKDIGTKVEMIDDHEFLRLLASPNEMLTQCGLMMMTAACFKMTGRCAWWFDSSGSMREDTGTTERLWYVPWHWLTPVVHPETFMQNGN